MSKFNFIKKNFIDKNIKIFPVMENKKLPLIDAWQKDCSSDLQQIVYWLENAKGCNIGLPANENDLFIIDIDMHGVDGVGNFIKLLNDLGVDIKSMNTLAQTTPSGGIHLIFKSDEELKNVTNSANCFKNYQGIDIRTKGYILVEPSVINGVPYRLNLKEVNKMPDKLRQFILDNNTKQEEVRKKRGYEKPIKVEKGSRDSELFDYLNQLYYKTRLDQEEIRLLAYHFNQTICDPPLSEGVVDYKVDKLFKKKRNKYILINISDDE